MIRHPHERAGEASGRRGIAVVLALAILAISIGLVYAVSRSSVTQFKCSVHEGAGVRAGFAAEMAAAVALEQLTHDPNWMPESNHITGTLGSGEPFQVDVQVIDDGQGRGIVAHAQVIGDADQKTIGDQRLTIRLARQRRDNFPRSAIVALAPGDAGASSPAVFAGLGATIVGDIRAKGLIRFQQGVTLQGQNYVLGNIAQTGTGAIGYAHYRAGWGTSYAAESLGAFGASNGSQLNLANVALGPSAANPMGVFQHTGDLTLGQNVTIIGTLVVTGNLSIAGTNVRLTALTAATVPESGAQITTSFPAVVADGSVTFQSSADVVRVSGLIVAKGDVTRIGSVGSSVPPVDEPTQALDAVAVADGVADTHNHAIPISDPTVDVFDTADGPAIYIKGAIMANRVSIERHVTLPFALVFDAARTDTTDAPGFFTWRATQWTEGN